MHRLSRQLARRLISVRRDYNVVAPQIPNLFTTRNFTIIPKFYCTETAVDSTITNLIKQLDKSKRISLKQLENVLPYIAEGTVVEDQIILLLNCCGKSMPYASALARDKVCQEIYEHALKTNKVTIDVCHTYIKVCTENHVLLDHAAILADIKCEPQPFTYKALLDNVSEQGNVAQAVSILKLMKNNQIGIDEKQFNSLILAHTIKDGIEGADVVLQTMKAALIPPTDDTIFAIFKGLVIRNDESLFKQALTRYKLPSEESRFLQIIEEAGLHGNLSLLSTVLQFGHKPVTKEYVLKVDFLCMSLIHMGQPEAAMAIYEALVEPVAEKKYGHFLLREMLLCHTPIDKVLKIVHHLRDTDLNPYVVENTTEIALRLKQFDVALQFFEHLTDLKSHYFWPLLLEAGCSKGELGVLNMLKHMLSKGVRPDAETLDTYVLIHFNLSDPKLVIKSLQGLGLTVRELLAPLLVVLLLNNKVRRASKVCSAYSGPLKSGKLFKLLPSAWKASNQSSAIVVILQRICESDDCTRDLVGDFLVECFSDCRSIEDIRQFLKLGNCVAAKKLRIGATSAYTLNSLVTARFHDEGLSSALTKCVDDLQDLSMQEEEEEFMLHSKNMDLEQLECHLVELKQKNMETRGVLRRLIQKYYNASNFQRVIELEQEFTTAGYQRSAGMKSSLMHTYTQQGRLDSALTLYEDLSTNHPNMKLDDFKIIDLATLMVRNDKFEPALNMLIKETQKRKVFGGRAIERNCCNLLASIEDDVRQFEMFQFLLKFGYCTPTNIVLGHLLRTYLNKGDIATAIEKYISFAVQYQVTPLQFEILSAAIDDKEALKKVVEATAKVHGQMNAAVGLIAALAERGSDNNLIEYLMSLRSIPIEELEKRCDRWVMEGKVEPLLNLDRALRRLRRGLVHNNFIHLSIMKVYSLKNDCDSAVAFYDGLIDDDQTSSPELEIKFVSLLKKCNYEIPDKYKFSTK